MTRGAGDRAPRRFSLVSSRCQGSAAIPADREKREIADCVSASFFRSPSSASAGSAVVPARPARPGLHRLRRRGQPAGSVSHGRPRPGRRFDRRRGRRPDRARRWPGRGGVRRGPAALASPPAWSSSREARQARRRRGRRLLARQRVDTRQISEAREGADRAQGRLPRARRPRRRPGRRARPICTTCARRRRCSSSGAARSSSRRSAAMPTRRPSLRPRQNAPYTGYPGPARPPAASGPPSSGPDAPCRAAPPGAARPVRCHARRPARAWPDSSDS